MSRIDNHNSIVDLMRIHEIDVHIFVIIGIRRFIYVIQRNLDNADIFHAAISHIHNMIAASNHWIIVKIGGSKSRHHNLYRIVQVIVGKGDLVHVNIVRNLHPQMMRHRNLTVLQRRLLGHLRIGSNQAQHGLSHTVSVLHRLPLFHGRGMQIREKI